jgi:hypothetical protein
VLLKEYLDVDDFIDYLILMMHVDDEPTGLALLLHPDITFTPTAARAISRELGGMHFGRRNPEPRIRPRLAVFRVGENDVLRTLPPSGRMIHFQLP